MTIRLLIFLISFLVCQSALVGSTALAIQVTPLKRVDLDGETERQVIVDIEKMIDYSKKGGIHLVTMKENSSSICPDWQQRMLEILDIIEGDCEQGP